MKKHLCLLLLIVTAGAVTACGSLSAITINSDPPGATVRALGRDLGATPVKIAPDQAFPPRFVGGSYRAVGRLEIDKPGCKPYNKDVNDAMLSKDIMVKLKCGPGAASTTQKPVGRRAVSRGDHKTRNVRERLMTLEGLRKDGLVTEKEYQAIRKRILGGL